MEFEALMHDKKLNLPKPKREEKPLVLSEKQEAAIELAQQQARARMAKRYGR